MSVRSGMVAAAFGAAILAAGMLVATTAFAEREGESGRTSLAPLTFAACAPTGTFSLVSAAFDSLLWFGIGLIFFLARLLWCQAPVVILYGGAHSSPDDYTAHTHAITKRWRLARVIVFTPRDCYDVDFWADYIADKKDIEWYMRWGYSRRDAVWEAYKWSMKVDCALIPAALALGQAHVVAFRRLMCVGVSNGSVPATELALASGARGLLLCSGPPAEHQVNEKLQQIATRVATVSERESLGRQRRVLRIYAQLGGDDGAHWQLRPRTGRCSARPLAAGPGADVVSK